MSPSVKRIAASIGGALILAAFAAWAGSPSGMTQELCFSSSDAGQVPRDSVSRGVELQNQGSTVLWCGMQLKANAIVNHSRSIAAGGTWAMDGAAQNAVWCVAGGGVDQQSSLDGGANGTVDGGPAGCTIISNIH